MDTELKTDIPIDAVERPEVDGDGALPTPTAGAMIVFEAVRKIYEPNVAALTDVSFVIEKGDFVFVVGASGSGKSTVIRLVLKEIEPTAGRIVVGGRDLTRLKRSKVPYLRRNIGCVFQDFKLLPDRTAAENVAYALKVQGEGSSSIRRKVPEVLNLVGLAHKMSSLPDELSGGEQQRVSIARAVVNHPPLLIWAFSLSNHYRHELVVKVYFDHGVADHGKEVSDVQSKLAANPLVKSVTPVSAEAGLAQMRKKNPELFKGSTLPYNPLGPALTVQPKRGEDTVKIADTLQPLP